MFASLRRFRRFFIAPEEVRYDPVPPEVLAREKDTERRIREFLAKPPPRRPRVEDHDWAMDSWTCLRCGVTKVKFYAACGLPCLKTGWSENVSTD